MNGRKGWLCSTLWAIYIVYKSYFTSLGCQALKWQLVTPRQFYHQLGPWRQSGRQTINVWTNSKAFNFFLTLGCFWYARTGIQAPGHQQPPLWLWLQCCMNHITWHKYHVSDIKEIILEKEREVGKQLVYLQLAGSSSPTDYALWLMMCTQNVISSPETHSFHIYIALVSILQMSVASPVDG